jgi:hypothetical protein
VAVLIVIIIFVLIAGVVALVGAPLRRAADARARPAAVDRSPAAAAVSERSARRDDLEAAREAKYREIRDAELDFRTGKLSEPDYRTLDGELRSEALEILDAIEALEADAQGRG